ncbi:MAG: hypothetical protein E7249_02125 [Paenibacillaceae bacterium]|nr:hypothetical protein [Paenibacillaceae bacterium]
MNDIIELRDEFLKQINKLLNYVKLLNDDEKAYYRNNQEILYVGIINRSYSLWETFNKDLLYAYYLLMKDTLIREGNLVQRLKLYELPGYIFEDGTYDNIKNSINFELKKDFITYTGKNMDTSQLKSLYGRFDIKIDNKLANSKVIREFLTDKESLFQINDINKSHVDQALSRLIQERNIVSHYSTIDDYQNLETVKIWIEFYQVVAKELSKIVCCNYLNTVCTNAEQLGKYVGFYKKKNLLLIDVNSDIAVTNNSYIGLANQDTLEQVLIPVSFMVNDNCVEQVTKNDKAGIQLLSIFDNEWNIKPTSNLIVLDKELFR